MPRTKARYYKVLVGGRSCHGGSLAWSLPKGKKPGKWHTHDGAVSICSAGLHLTSEPSRWWKEGATCYEAEFTGRYEQEGDKIAVGRCRLLREVAWDSVNVFSEGEHTITNAHAVALGSSSVVARESSSVVAWGSSSVVAWGSSSVVAWGSSRVVARESSSVVAWGSSRVVAWGSSSVVARGSSRVVARESSSVVARESSSVVARESSSVVARELSSVVARGSSRVVASEWSSVVARESSNLIRQGGSWYRHNGAASLHDAAACIDRRAGAPKLYAAPYSDAAERSEAK